MIVINVSSLKARLSETLRRVKDGEALVVTDRRTPVARLIPYETGDEDGRIIERKAESVFRAVRAERPARDIDAMALLSAERGDR